MSIKANILLFVIQKPNDKNIRYNVLIYLIESNNQSHIALRPNNKCKII